jgi:hypothetical protein
MTTSNVEGELIRSVQQQINSGRTHIVLPGNLVSAASDELLAEIRRLCKLSGVTVEVRM